MSTRRRFLLQVLSFFFVVTLGWPAETPAPRVVRVLFIGNSYTYGNDLPGTIAHLMASRGWTLEHRSVTPGGATLEKHWSDGVALAAIKAERWDYVVLQEQSARPFLDRELMFDAARKFDAEIRRAGAKTLLYETWAALASPDEQPKLTDAYGTLGRELRATVVPVGEAWKRALSAGLGLHGSDGRHPNRRGTYLAACLFVRVLTHASPVGLPAGGVEAGKPWKVEEAGRLQDFAANTSLAP